MDTEKLCFHCDCREEVGYPLSTTIACHIPFQFVPFFRVQQTWPTGGRIARGFPRKQRVEYSKR